jgi:hypothetical protein
MSDGRRAGTSTLEEVPRQNEGAIAIFDSESGKCIWSLTLDTPAGFAVDKDRIYVNSMYGNRISCFDTKLQIVDSISSRVMNDLHSLVKNGTRLLLTSSGLDAVLEVDMNGKLAWSWLASHRAYRRNPRGIAPRIDRRADYRKMPIVTLDQTTHCNSAVAATVDGRDAVLVSLFHQGELIAVDRATKRHKVLVTGMTHPHSIRARRDGWIVSDSRAGAVILLDRDFWVTDIVEADFNWVQDALEIDDQCILVADANNSRLLTWDVRSGRPADMLQYPSEWKVYQVEVLDPSWEAAVRAAVTS